MATLFYHAQTNVQLQISSAKPYCELAAKQPIFETSQSCVSTKVTPFAPIQILTVDTRKGCVFRCGWLLDERRSFQRKPCIERRFESSPESRGSQTSGVLPVLFVQAKRINSFSLQRTSRFCKPRFSSPQWRLRTNKIPPHADI